MNSRSQSQSSQRQRSPSPNQQPTKLFITNLDGKSELKDIETELTRQFQKYGQVLSLVVKRNRNSEYCFAFAEMKGHDVAAQCVKHFDQSSLAGKQIKVEFQDDTKRRKDSSLGCYNCGKKGHFARECRAPRSDDRGFERRGRSRSRSHSESYHRRKHKKRYRSYSSERDRSYDRVRKQKKRRDHSRDREDKKKKKHRRRSDSD